MKHPSRSRSHQLSQKRELRRIIRVLTEGKVTEPGYLRMLERNGINVKIEIDLKDTGVPLTLVQRAREYQRLNKKKNPDFDEIWCIFDVDQHPNLKSAIQEALDSNINIAISNPCFELWLVLHYQDQTSHINRRDIQKVAKRLGILKGKHLTEDSKDKVRESYEDAKSRAQRLEKWHKSKNSKSWENPSSQMWKFVDRLENG